MPDVVLYLQMHQPHRLRAFSVFDEGHDYFDRALNDEICQRVTTKCYRPLLHTLADLRAAHGRAFRFAISITGPLVDQLECVAPDVLTSLRELVSAGAAEILSETEAHSLSFLYDPAEFRAQVELHATRVEALLGVRPRVFRNTELIYANALASELSEWTEPDGSPRFDGCLAEGVRPLLGERSPNGVFRAKTRAGSRRGGFPLLLRNDRLSDDIAFRFGDREWGGYPLTPAKFADWVAAGPGALRNLFMDSETFGEHQWADTGIFEFLRALPGALLERGVGFRTPSEALAGSGQKPTYDCPEPSSWADARRDCSAWLGNALQHDAADALYALLPRIKRALATAEASGHAATVERVHGLLHDWRRLSTSDHLYYASTAQGEDGQVHGYFSPYDSPYEAYINLMNVLDSLKDRVDAVDPNRRAPT